MSGPESALRARAQMLIAEGKLVRSVPLRSVAVLGHGLPCALCGETILDTEAEVEACFLLQPFEPYVFHPRCYAVWFTESVTREAKRSASGGLRRLVARVFAMRWRRTLRTLHRERLVTPSVK